MLSEQNKHRQENYLKGSLADLREKVEDLGDNMTSLLSDLNHWVNGAVNAML